MNDITKQCLEVFPQWLDSLGRDVRSLNSVLQNSKSSESVRRNLAGGINYLFKSLDLIPDGIDNIGYLDDAFVLRMAAASAVSEGIDSVSDDVKERLNQLAADTALIKELLGDDLFSRFKNYTDILADGSARGRTVDEIIEDSQVAGDFFNEVTLFAEEYNNPGFTDDEKNIIKLKSFMDAKLPR